MDTLRSKGPAQFKDHFSDAAEAYRRFRPEYPDSLFRYLAFISSDRERAWDCAAGSGQAARGLARYFQQVIATDASQAQIASAVPHPHVVYQVAEAGRSRIRSRSIDLITVAQALHWLDLDRFYPEARRVLKEGGIIAVWSYRVLRIHPEIDAVIDKLYSTILEGFWPPERRHVASGYHDLPFPFQELLAPPFSMTSSWPLDRFIGYLNTWSAVRIFKKKKRTDPLEEVRGTLERLWGPPAEIKTVHWPLSLRIGIHRRDRREGPSSPAESR